MLVVSREITVVEERIPKVQKGDPEGRGHNTRGASRCPSVNSRVLKLRVNSDRRKIQWNYDRSELDYLSAANNRAPRIYAIVLVKLSPIVIQVTQPSDKLNKPQIYRKKGFDVFYNIVCRLSGVNRHLIFRTTNNIDTRIVRLNTRWSTAGRITKITIQFDTTSAC